MRFEMMAGFYVLVFSAFYPFSAGQRALLVLLIGAVLAAELLNTAVERVCDRITTAQDAAIRFIKDVAAGAVLLLSIAATAIGVIFFWDLDVIRQIFCRFAACPWMCVLLILSLAVWVLFVAVGPCRLRRMWRRRGGKK